jgi:hypothetical protein
MSTVAAAVRMRPGLMTRWNSSVLGFLLYAFVPRRGTSFAKRAVGLTLTGAAGSSP